jgi:hypothetical protein
VIYAVPKLSKRTTDDLARLDAMRAQLGEQTRRSVRGMARLRRSFQAEAAAGSVGIEGFRVTPNDALSIVERVDEVPAGDDNRAALACYARAMDHATAMCADPAFRWTDRVILDLQFDVCWFQSETTPGLWRTGPVSVTTPNGDGPTFVGPDARDVPGLMEEVVADLATETDDHVVVRAAMAHLNLVSVHPFADGNGRTARIVQALVLGRDGVLGPDLASIEEYLGRNTRDYYAVLRQVQGGSHQPERDAAPWVRFCVAAHIDQARRRLDQLTAASRRWTVLEQIVEDPGWPDRLVVALEQALFGRVDRASYAREATVSDATASNDLRRLLDSGLLESQGQGRGAHYVPTERLMRVIDQR